MTEEGRLGKLKKYVPFMDYVITSGYMHKNKFSRMRQWILDNTKFSKEYSEKIEESIFVAYNYICKHPSFPAELHRAFAVDLSSDDDDIVIVSQRKIADKRNQNSLDIVTILSDNEIDDGDIEIISITVPKSPPSSNKNKGKSKTADPNKEILNRFANAAHCVNDSRQVTLISNSNNELQPQRRKPNNLEGPPNHLSKSLERLNITNHASPSRGLSGINHGPPRQLSEPSVTESHRNPPTTDAEKPLENSSSLSNCFIYKRRKDLIGDIETENSDFRINFENFLLEKQHENGHDEKSISKKKKKKHKKKHNKKKKNKSKSKYIVVDNIVLSSSTDDEDISNASRSPAKDIETRSASLDIIGNLDEPDLLKIIHKGIAKIRTETNPKVCKNQESISSTTDKETDVKSLTEIISEPNEINESELIQMKDDLMKQMGLTQSASELLKNLDLGSLDVQPSNKQKEIEISSTKEVPPSSVSHRNKEAIRILSNEIVPYNTKNSPLSSVDFCELRTLLAGINNPTTRTAENSNNTMYQPIPTIDIQHSSAELPPIPQAPQQHLCQPIEELNEFNREIESDATPSSTHISHTLNFIEPPQPVPPPTVTPVNITPNLTELSIPVITSSQHMHSRQAQQFHGPSNVYTEQSFPTNLSPTVSMGASNQLPSRSNLVPIETVSHNSIPVIASSLQIGLRTQELPPTSSNLNYAHNLLSTPNSLPTGPGNPVSLSMPVYSTIANPTHGETSPLYMQNRPSAPINLPSTPAIPHPRPLFAAYSTAANPTQPLTTSFYGPNRLPAPLNLPSGPAIPVSNSLPANPTITNPIHAAPTPARSQLPLKDPRLRKMIEEGSYPRCRQEPPTNTQTSYSRPATIIHNWDQPDSSCTDFQRDKMVQTLSKNIEPRTTKSVFSYGDQIRKMNKRRQQFFQQETLKRDEERKRNEEERKRLEKEEQQQAAKKIEEIELKKQTEHRKQILNTREDEIVHEIRDSFSREQQTSNENAVISNKSQINKKSSTANSINDNKTTPPRRKSCTAQDRVLRELKCTVKGFNTIHDFISSNGIGKRRCSVSARMAIASQLGPLDEVAYHGEVSPTTDSSKRRRSSSTSTEGEVNPIKHKKNNEKVKENTLPKMKSCKVVLKRMSNVEIAKYLKRYNAPIITILEKNPFAETLSIATVVKPTNEVKKNTQGKLYATKSSSASIDLKNIDCQMTERNCDTCVLCKARSPNLTNHFIRLHKKESYLSRLTWEELDDLAMQVPFAEEVQTTPQNGKSTGTGKFIQRYKVKCPFCPESQRKIIDTFQNLRRHYSTHTGEYAFQCKGCGLQKPYRKDISSHQKRTKCVDSGLQTLYQYPPDLMTIYMYLCQICNFVQLNEENVFKHLREQHGKMHKDQRYVKEYTLAAIKDGPIERVRIGMIPGSQNLMEDTYLQQENNDNENVVVSNEPLSDENSQNVKRKEMFGKNELLWDTEKKTNVDENAECFEQTALDLDIKPEIDTLLESIFFSSKENLIKLTTGNEVDLKTVEQESIKEEKPDPEKLALESAKAILRKYSANTGIQPDLLYHCADQDCRGYFSNFKLWSSHMTTRHNAIISRCPHCMKSNKHTDTEDMELPITDFEQHFQTHSLRSFICFHCDTRCVDEKDLREHAKQFHSDITEIRIERIPFNFTYAYHVLIEKDMLTTRLNFLLELCTVLRERIQRIEAQTDDSEYVSAQWPVSKTTSWLEDLNLPIYSALASKPKCVLSSCQQTFSNPFSLLEHLWVHNSHMTYLFTCTICGSSGPPKTLPTIVEHNIMHSENLFVCCVCKYITYDRRVLSKHICCEHDKRDVLVLAISRSETDVNCTIEFVFASGSKTFTTSRECFCGCGTNDLRVDTFVSHLKREHMLKLRYFCQHCDERLPQLQLSDEHFRLKHAESDLVVKVRCQLACSKDRHVNIVSLQPLQIQLSDESYHLSTSETGLPIKKNTTKSDDNNDDSGIIFMEDDEVVAEQEAKEAQITKTATRTDIKCTSIWKLKA